MSIVYIKNSDISRILIGTPIKHKHLRVVIELRNGEKIIFSEATIANIVRAYVTIKTHPKINSLELESYDLSDDQNLKEGYSKFQLLETNKESLKISYEIEKILDEANKE